MKTGEDAIAFFAKHGTNTDLKFVYCNLKASEKFEPYDLVVVLEKEIKKTEYFTVSMTGVVYISSGALSEQYPLGVWLHQSLMFRVLQSMRFFKNWYRIKMTRNTLM